MVVPANQIHKSSLRALWKATESSSGPSPPVSYSGHDTGRQEASTASGAQGDSGPTTGVGAVTRGVRRWRGALAAVTTATLVAALAACTDRAPEPEPEPEPTQAAAEVPTLERMWSIRGLNANPETVGQHHWMTYQSTLSGIGRGTSLNRGPLLLVDARAGRARQRTPEGDRWPCLLPDRLSDNGLVPVLWAHREAQGFALVQSEPCTRITVHDATTGQIAWRASDLDLDGLGPRRVMGSSDTVVAVVDRTGKRTCFGARDGRTLPDSHRGCLRLRDRLLHTDLPRLLDPEGKEAPITPTWEETADPAGVEIGRTDEILLVRVREEVIEDGMIVDVRQLVRAHDLSTGETVWEDEVELDPNGSGPWRRDETYAVAPSGVIRVSYEHSEDEESAVRTPMVVTAVDALTGEDLQPVARATGAWFNHQFGDVTVALTEQQLLFHSTISGFELPTW